MIHKIIFDINGNDNGIKAAITASLEFVKNNLNYKIILVGNKKEISKYANESERIEFFDSPTPVIKDNNVIGSYKENNSMNDALKLLKKGEGSAVLSSSDSAKYLSSALMILKRIPGIDRPAFMSVLPTIFKDKKVLLLDEGANLQVKPEYLVQWANVASIFSQEILSIPKPKVAILNIGTESNKGFDHHKEANQILLNSSNSFEYKGFIESRYILEGEVDVVVTDGYAGNIALKSLEGTVLSFSKLMKSTLTKNLYRKMMALSLKKSFKDIKEHLDYRNVGAAWILGINGIVIKAHGSSDKKAYLGALSQIANAIEADALNKMKQKFQGSDEE